MIVEPYFFVDLLVFPKPVLAVWTNATDPKTGKVLWNEAGKQLTRLLVAETVAEFPLVKGWIVRTGETYVFDLPFHTGNSPVPRGLPVETTIALWADFVNLLREELCVKAKKQLIMRSWDSFPSDALWYLNLTARIEPHSLLYFSIKHTPADFVRPSQWNPMLGVGAHAQIVEIELQREYEGKQAFPNYIVDGVIDGFPEMADKVGIASLVGKPQFRGYWSWSRGGGWWGPYIHGNEWGVDLHMQTLARWWSGGHPGRVSEPVAFAASCEALFLGCTRANFCCDALRVIVQNGALSVLHGVWGANETVGDWMRDDRMCGLSCTAGAFTAACAAGDAAWAAGLAERAWAKSNSASMLVTFESTVANLLSDVAQRGEIRASVSYGAYLFAIVDAAWRVMAQGFLKGAGNAAPPSCGPNTVFNQTELTAAICDYDAAQMAYRAFGLANVFAASLYHDYYFCLGDDCNGSFEPGAGKAGDSGKGIGALVDSLRSTGECSATATRGRWGL